MDLSNLKAPKPNKKNKKRIGRGQGSGYGGHTVGKGHNGQKARSGHKEKFWFEGGQMPLQRRVPKFGFNNPFRTDYEALNVDTLDGFIGLGKLDKKVTISDLRSAGVIGKSDLVKLLGRGKIETKVDIEVHAASKSAKKKIEDAGGSVTIVEN
ncbi:50S ribosomal protein L15 [Aliifodinibius sp. S!AR15-10]|uniref:50S ribosomal protein L15 n=1 Tax=Aliifodinibius sp. S!AR15-10 TaxID=2950437 RepID=UPI00285AA31F|nr:50S ribosomal protein L15 [Aliifodinibius sp. S!AR15-10]MDR8394516.1 50S ribosomal protein L15 [Aliifodinibius sp. S!AR15-10]